MEPINDPTYWAGRLQKAVDLHHAVFKCPLDRWQRIEAKHRKILAEILPTNKSTTLLDVGCGYGRLLDLLPKDRVVHYVGVDLCPEFIQLAKTTYNYTSSFFLADVSKDRLYLGNFDIAIFVSIRPMVKRNLGDEAWLKIEENVRKVADRLLFLEYDENDEGSLE